MNQMKSPVLSFVRQDGRSLLTASRLRFMPELAQSEEETATDIKILEPGLIIGAVIRCQWIDRVHWRYAGEVDIPRSMRVHISGTYEGEVSQISYIGHGQTLRTEPAPVFDMNVWRNEGQRTPIGSVAVRYLAENERPILDGVDHHALYRSFTEINDLGYFPPRLSTVQIGGLYYVPPHAHPMPAS